MTLDQCGEKCKIAILTSTVIPDKKFRLFSRQARMYLGVSDFGDDKQLETMTEPNCAFFLLANNKLKVKCLDDNYSMFIRFHGVDGEPGDSDHNKELKTATDETHGAMFSINEDGLTSDTVGGHLCPDNKSVGSIVRFVAAACSLKIFIVRYPDTRQRVTSNLTADEPVLIYFFGRRQYWEVASFAAQKKVSMIETSNDFGLYEFYLAENDYVYVSMSDGSLSEVELCLEQSNKEIKTSSSGCSEFTITDTKFFINDESQTGLCPDGDSMYVSSECDYLFGFEYVVPPEAITTVGTTSTEATTRSETTTAEVTTSSETTTAEATTSPETTTAETTTTETTTAETTTAETTTTETTTAEATTSSETTSSETTTAETTTAETTTTETTTASETTTAEATTSPETTTAEAIVSPEITPPSVAIVSPEITTPSVTIVSPEITPPSEAIVSPEITPPSEAIVSPEIATPSVAIVSLEITTPSEAIVSPEITPPSVAIVSPEITTPSVAIVSPEIKKPSEEITVSTEAITMTQVYGGRYQKFQPLSMCSPKCFPGKISGRKICSEYKFYDQNNLPDDFCTATNYTYVDCLEQDGCNGTRLYLADEGKTCTEFCSSRYMICSTLIETGNTADVFNNVIVHHTVHEKDHVWINNYAPYCLEGVCSEFENVPDSVDCDAATPSTKHRRLCHCQETSDVGFGSWSPWSECSSTCEGKRSKTRSCFDICNGNFIKEETCGEVHCPVHGGLSPWSHWTQCSQSCGGGLENRTRSCSNPKPQYNGSDCIGQLVENRECNPQYCPIDAHPNLWTEWSGCDKPCNDGNIRRKRTCVKGLYGGRRHCLEPLEESKPCNPALCPTTIGVLETRFQMNYYQVLSDKSSLLFKQTEEVLKQEFRSMFEDRFNSAIVDLKLNSVRRGSIIANYTIYFEHFDSYQFLYIQDSLEQEKAIGKLPILQYAASYNLSPGIPTASPSNITITTLSSTSFNLSWKEVPYEHHHGNITGYIILYREKRKLSAPYELLASYNLSIILIGLKPGTEYAFRLLAYTPNGNGVASVEILKFTKEELPDDAPFDVNATSYGPFAAYIEWEAVPRDSMNGVPLGYKIVAYFGNVTYDDMISPFTDRSAIFPDLIPDTTYIFEVCAFNSVGPGPCDMALTTTDVSPPSAPPQNVSVDIIRTHNTLTLHWTMPPVEKIYGDLLSYKIMFTEKRRGTKIITGVSTNYITVHASFTKYTLSFLRPNTLYEIQILAVNGIGEGVAATVEATTCRCPEIVSSNFFKLAPYIYEDNHDLVGVFPQVIDDLVTFACGTCERPSGIKDTFLDKSRNGRNGYSAKGSIDQLINEIDDFTDLSFPVIGYSDLTDFLGYKYVPLLKHPGIVLIVRDKNINAIVVDMILSILNIWPLLLLNVVMMTLVGMFMWILEGFHALSGDFSSSKEVGIFEGIYWAFITQGTHGYGDYVPKLVSSRLLAVVWILTGLIVTSLIVGSIVTSLSTVNEAAKVKIYGAEIGAINSTFEQRVGTMRNGKVNTKSSYTTTAELAAALDARDVEGVLIDAYTAGSSRKDFQRPQVRASEMITYPRTYGFVLSGDLVNVDEEVRDFVEVNQQRIVAIIENSTIRMEPSEKPEYKSPFDPSSETLATAIVWLLSLLAIAVLFGITHSTCLRYRATGKVEIVITDKECQLKEVKTLGNEISSQMKYVMDNVEKITTKHEIQRVKLYYDRGASSLRMQPKQRRKARLTTRTSGQSSIRNDDSAHPLTERVSLDASASNIHTHRDNHIVINESDLDIKDLEC